MFVTRKTLDREIDLKDDQLKQLWDYHWKLLHKHNDLLRHLDLYEVEIPGKIEIRKIK